MPKWSTGLELILNACEGALQIAVTDDEEVLCFQEWFAPRRATETLAPALKTIFSQLQVQPRHFRRIACITGPGSFTGIRLVLSTAAAMRRVTRAQLASLDYLQALASSAVIWRGLPYGKKVFVLTHARRNLLHMRLFISYGPQIPAQPLTELKLVTPQKALQEISGSPSHVCGSALAQHPEIFKDPYADLEPEDHIGPVYMPRLIHPQLAALRLLARHGDYFPKDLEPVYARSCDAVENLPHIAQKQGVDPEQARARLEQILQQPPDSDI